MKKLLVGATAALTAVALSGGLTAAQDGAYTFPDGSSVTGTTTCAPLNDDTPSLSYTISFSGAKTDDLTYQLSFTRGGESFGSPVTVPGPSGTVDFPTAGDYLAEGWTSEEVTGGTQLVPGSTIFSATTGVRIIATVTDTGDGNATYTSEAALVGFNADACLPGVLLPPSIDVGGFAPVCVADAPFISYEITLINLEWPGSATLTFTDINGNPVSAAGSTTPAPDVVVVTEPKGTVVFPGGSYDGTVGTDWPGWRLAQDGSWEPDPNDEILRQGVNILVEVNPSASVLVTYPPATEVCANPPEVGVQPPPGPPATSPPPSRPLPSAGLSTLETSLRMGALLLIGGLGIVIVSRRRRYTSASPVA